MKQYFTTLLICLLYTQHTQAQDCEKVAYDRQIAKADSCQNEGNYAQAQEHYNTAKILCNSQSETVEKLKDTLFEHINTLYTQSKKLIDAFFDRKYVLSRDNVFNTHKLHFIDKNGDMVDKLGEWEYATEFDQDGYAEVMDKYDNKYFLDTLGNKYYLEQKPKQYAVSIDKLNLPKQPTGINPKTTQTTLAANMPSCNDAAAYQRQLNKADSCIVTGNYRRSLRTLQYRNCSL